MRMTLPLIYVSIIMIMNGCNSSSQTNTTNDVSQNPDVAPITKGNWYHPGVLTTWQWQLTGSINTSYAVEIYDVDLFNTPLATIEELHASGKKVICYFSAGSYEDFRTDKDRFLSDELGRALDGYDDERWLDIRSTNVHNIMKSRLDLAQKKGCDGVEPDNVDGYINNSGFPLTAADQLAFNKFIANEAHQKELSVALKNDLDQINELVDYFDFAVNEQCFSYSECSALFPFINEGKPVLNTEYAKQYVNDASQRNTLCSKSLNYQFSTLILPLDLDDTFRFSCL